MSRDRMLSRSAPCANNSRGERGQRSRSLALMAGAVRVVQNRPCHRRSMVGVVSEGVGRRGQGHHGGIQRCDQATWCTIMKG